LHLPVSRVCRLKRLTHDCDTGSAGVSPASFRSLPAFPDQLWLDKMHAGIALYLAENDYSLSPGSSRNENQKFNLPAVHFMKIRNGRMYEIEAIGTMMPYGVSSNWE
jgi:hypothetical protein